jgi:hypothetical protein
MRERDRWMIGELFRDRASAPALSVPGDRNLADEPSDATTEPVRKL